MSLISSFFRPSGAGSWRAARALLRSSRDASWAASRWAAFAARAASAARSRVAWASSRMSRCAPFFLGLWTVRFFPLGSCPGSAGEVEVTVFDLETGMPLAPSVGGLAAAPLSRAATGAGLEGSASSSCAFSAASAAVRTAVWNGIALRSLLPRPSGRGGPQWPLGPASVRAPWAGGSALQRDRPSSPLGLLPHRRRVVWRPILAGRHWTSLYVTGKHAAASKLMRAGHTYVLVLAHSR